MSLEKKLDILIATQNKGKISELKSLLSDLDINISTLEGVEIVEPEENGSSFEENAMIKSQYYAKKMKKIALSDDSGICIDVLQGMPGIFSARWAGDTKDFNVAIARVKDEIVAKGIDINSTKLDAYFFCAISVTFLDGRSEVFSGRIDGVLTFPMRGTQGFGYDPIFIPNGEVRTFAEMTKDEKARHNHRTIALNKLKKYINSCILKT